MSKVAKFFDINVFPYPRRRMERFRWVFVVYEPDLIGGQPFKFFYSSAPTLEEAREEAEGCGSILATFDAEDLL